MSKNPILNFKQFSGIFEDDVNSSTEEQVGKSIDVIVQIFFEVYGTLVTRLGGYKEAVQDLQAIANSVPDKRGDLMVTTIDKLGKLAIAKDSTYKDAVDLYNKSALDLKGAYDKIIAEDKNQAIGITKRIKDSIISYLDYLTKAVKNTEVPKEEAKNESVDYSLILEKDLYQKERTGVIRRMLPLKAKAETLSVKSVFPELKTKAKGFLKKYEDLIKNLQDDSLFTGKKKSEILKDLEDSRIKMIEIENELNTLLSDTIVKYGIKKEINDLVNKALTSLTSANTKLKEADAEIARKKELAKEETEGEEKEEEKTGEDKEYKEIEFGKLNSEEVMDVQKKINTIVPKEFKIDEDGDYGKNTEKSLEMVVSLLKGSATVPADYKLETKKITPELQKNMDKYINEVLPKLRKELQFK